MRSVEVHNVLEAASKALKVDPTTHARGPKPILYNPTYLELVIWIAEQVAPKLDAKESAEVGPMLAVARRVRAGDKLDKEKRHELAKVGNRPSIESDGATIATSLASEAHQVLINDNCGKATRAAAMVAAKLLGESFLPALAKEIVRLDAVTSMEQQKLGEKSPIVESLWRGSSGTKVTHTLVRLEDGRYGLIAKTKGRWTWTTGSRDDVLATVPDVMMSSAVEAVLGKGEGAAPKKAHDAPSGLIASLPGRVGAVAIDAQGRFWSATQDGRLVTWDDAGPHVSKEKVGRVEGMAVGGGIAVTWGAATTVWTDGKPKRLAQTIDGALVLEDGMIVWWRGGEIHFGKKKARGPGEIVRLAFDLRRAQVLAFSADTMRRFHPDGTPDGDVALHDRWTSISPDCRRIATWSNGAKSKTVHVADMDDGALIATLEVDSGHIDQVVFALDRLLVRHYEMKRVTIFDAEGKKIHRMQARDLGSRGSAADELHPLSRGQVIAFVPYPKGEVVLVDEREQLVTSWFLGRFYTGGKSHVADGGDRVLFAHHKTSTQTLRF